MSGVSIIPLMFVVGIVLATIGLGIYATRMSRTASDFYVAGRGVNAFWNSSAISGEYLSAASFMGIAGMIMKFGYDVLWYAVGYAAGYVFLLLFIAGPLRRFGAYTIPDFAEGRFDSKNMRKVAVVFALCISFFYMMPQMKGAGITLAQLLGSPYWVGVVVVGTVITLNVTLGGMKGITFTQAFQYWVKMFAIAVPMFILMAVFGPYNAMVEQGGQMNVANPAAAKDPNAPKYIIPVGDGAAKTTIENNENLLLTETATYKYPQAGTLKFGSKTTIKAITDVEGKIQAAPDPAVMSPVTGLPTKKLGPKEPFKLAAGETYEGAKGSQITFTKKCQVEVQAPAKIPNVTAGNVWANPYGPFTSKFANPDDPESVKWIPLLYTYSLIVALLCGTAGLPHILVRFYTNPDGREAKKTTLLVIVMLSLFYIFPAMWGAMGRIEIPSLYVNGATDLVTIKLPTMIGNEVIGQILSGVTSAGAFAAFMTTFSGLLVSVSGAFAHDIYGRIMRHDTASQEDRLKAFKIAAIMGGAIAMSLGLLVENFDINMLVGWAFAIGASSYFPLLLMGAWWSKLTKAGAVVGMLGGGAAAVSAVVYSMLVDKGLAAASSSPVIMTLTTQPAIWTVPFALLLMVVVSLMTQRMVPTDIRLKMLKLHAPEQLGLKADYIKD